MVVHAKRLFLQGDVEIIGHFHGRFARLDDRFFIFVETGFVHVFQPAMMACQRLARFIKRQAVLAVSWTAVYLGNKLVAGFIRNDVQVLFDDGKVIERRLQTVGHRFAVGVAGQIASHNGFFRGNNQS